MRASIVIPVLNESAGIVRHLKSLQPLREHSIEIILVDGGSDDSTVELARPYVDTLVVSEKGRAMQMNAGVEKARGYYFFFLHADTSLPENFNNLLERFITKNISWGFFPVRLDDRNLAFRVIESAINLRSRITSIGTGDQLLFIRRDAFIQIGGFQVIPIMEDIAFSKVARRELGRAITPKQTVQTSARRWKEFGIFNTVFLMWRLRWAYWRGRDPFDLAKLYRYAPQAKQ